MDGLFVISYAIAFAYFVIERLKYQIYSDTVGVVDLAFEER